MSRTVSTPNGGTLSPISKVVCEYGTINTGDLVVMTEAGGVHAYTKDAPFPTYENNNTAGGKKLWSVGSAIVGRNSSYFRFDQQHQTIAKLSNGNFVQVVHGDDPNASSSYAINYGITNAAGSFVMPMTQVSGSSAVTIPTCGVYAFPSGGFAIVYAVASTIYMVVYDNNGTRTLADTAIITGYSAGTPNWQAVILSGGNLAIFYNNSAASALSFRRFNSSGVEQGTTLTVDNAAGWWYLFGAWETANGDVVTVYQDATSRTKISRVTAAGTLVGSPLNLGTTSSLWQSSMAKYCAVMNADNTVTVLASDTSNTSYAGLYFVSATNTLTASKTNANGLLTNATFNSGSVGIAASATPNQIVIVGYQSTVYFGEYTSTGGTITPYASFTGVSSPPNYVMSYAYNCGFMKVDAISSSVLVVASSGFDNSATTYNYNSILNVVSKTFNYTLFDGNGGTSESGIKDCTLSKDGTYMSAYNAGNSAYPSCYGQYLLRSGCYGVALSTFSKGSTGNVATLGSFDLTTTQQDGPAVGFDSSAYPNVYGNKGSISSKSVNLKGI